MSASDDETRKEQILNELREAGVESPAEAVGYMKAQRADDGESDEDDVERYKQGLVGDPQERDRREKAAGSSEPAEEPDDAVAAFKASLVGGSPDAHREKAADAEETSADEPSEGAVEDFKKALVGGGQTTGQERRRKEAAREDMTLEEQKQALLGPSGTPTDEPDRDVDDATEKFLKGAARDY